jgi:RNA polymerase primary sigma factor
LAQIDLLIRVINLLKEKPGLTGREYASILKDEGFRGINKHILNTEILYNYSLLFSPNFNNAGIPAWTLKQQGNDVKFEFDCENDIENDANILEYCEEINLYEWQQRALESWQRNGFRGVVEAVTGGGKTRLAIGAIQSHLLMGWKVLVLVPTIELMQQWNSVLSDQLKMKSSLSFEIGLAGSGYKQTLEDCDVLVSLIHSAAPNGGNLLPIGEKGLLIADECHRYASESWERALDPDFERRLGLTATYEREDGKISVLDSYFSEVCYQLDYDEAIGEGVIAEFNVAFLGLDLCSHEKKAFDEVDKRCRMLKNRLIKEYSIPEDPYSAFMSVVNHFSEGGFGEASVLSRSYRASVNKRKDILANAEQKYQSMDYLLDPIMNSERTIVFTQTKAGAKKVLDELGNHGFRIGLLDSDMKREERSEVLDGFRNGFYHIIVAPKLLDEGIDVPEADLGIVISASRTRRQMIQRMGRVIRKKNDGRPAKFIIMYIKGTSEDPECGAQETFIDMITETDCNLGYFDWSNDPGELVEFLYCTS